MINMLCILGIPDTGATVLGEFGKPFIKKTVLKQEKRNR